MCGLIVISNCYTHARRNFTDIIKAIPGFKKLTEEEKEEVLSYQIVKIIGRIFEKERHFRNMDADERLKRRVAESKSIVDELFDKLRSIPDSSFDKSSKLYEAVNYMTRQEKNFRVILEDGNVPVHNSACEQAIIPFTIGRNGWKCIDSIDGGITLGYFYDMQTAWGTAPDVLVNNAVIDTQPSAPPEVSGPFEDFPEEIFREVVDVNLSLIHI